MKKIIKDNLKKITALLLVAAMTVSMDSSVFAQDVIAQDEIVIEEDILSDEIEVEASDELIEEDDIEDSFIVEILCRKLLLLGYLKLEDGFYRRSNGTPH